MGRLTLMGSGELAPGLVRVHRAALEDHDQPTVAILDTPFGFQENADELTAKLVDFFRTSLRVNPQVATLRNAADDGAAARARGTLAESSVLFSGPGSPSYALRIWHESGLDVTLRQHCAHGTVTFASAAACTLGRWAIPVYEIYKVGAELSWLDGLDAFRLGGLPTVVVPHFDNREGGTHDTSHCYIGASRFERMRFELPDHVVVGIDEHTAASFRFEIGTVEVTGRGALHLVSGDEHQRLEPGTHDLASIDLAASTQTAPADPPLTGDRDLLSIIVAATGSGPAEEAALELAQRAEQASEPDVVAGPFIELLLRVRQELRGNGQYAEADRIRDAMIGLGVTVNDKADGSAWSLQRTDRPSS